MLIPEQASWWWGKGGEGGGGGGGGAFAMATSVMLSNLVENSRCCSVQMDGSFPRLGQTDVALPH